MTTSAPLIGIVMGSDSDWPVMEQAANMLDQLGIAYHATVASAHRTPERARAFAKGAEEGGYKAIIVGAGAAAHLGGVLAAEVNIPVIGVPIDSSPLKGMDALLATVQMPGGVPVACMAIGKAGAKNAGVFAAQIVAQSDPQVAARLVRYREEMAQQVARKAEALEARITAGG